VTASVGLTASVGDGSHFLPLKSFSLTLSPIYKKKKSFLLVSRRAGFDGLRYNIVIRGRHSGAPACLRRAMHGPRGNSFASMWSVPVSACFMGGFDAFDHGGIYRSHGRCVGFLIVVDTEKVEFSNWLNKTNDKSV